MEFWLNVLTKPRGTKAERDDAERAFHSMSVTSVPFIIEKLRQYDSWRYRFWVRLFPKLPAWLQAKVQPPQVPKRDYPRRLEDAAESAMDAIGAPVESYLPKMLNDGSVHVRRVGAGLLRTYPKADDAAYRLIAVAVNDSDPVVRVNAVQASRRLNRQAVPLLIRALDGDDTGGTTNSYVAVRAIAAMQLGQLGWDARTAVPKLKKLTVDTNDITRIEATIALWKLEGKSETVSLMVNELVKTTNEYLMNRIIPALGEAGPRAKVVVPVLTQIYHNHHPAMERRDEWHLREKSAEALKKIDPEAAAKPGLK